MQFNSFIQFSILCISVLIGHSLFSQNPSKQDSLDRVQQLYPIVIQAESVMRVDADSALQIINQAYNIDATHPIVLNTRIKIYLQIKEVDNAINDVEQLISHNPTIVEAYVLGGNLYEIKDDPFRSDELYANALLVLETKINQKESVTITDLALKGKVLQMLNDEGGLERVIDEIKLNFSSLPVSNLIIDKLNNFNRKQYFETLLKPYGNH